MFGLSYLFYPWGFIVQGLAIVHFVRRRPENYWFYIIFFGGFLGASVISWRKCCRTWGCFVACFRGLGDGHAYKRSKRIFWTIPRWQITKNWANSTKIRGNTRRRATRSIMRSPGEAIRSTRSIRGRNRRWD